jgi:CheY-like chemotaxis protein
LISEDIELSTWLEPELSHVEVDPGQIEQVLVNLVVNARDAMPNGGQLAIKTENVEIGRDRPGQNTGMNPGRYALLTVKDNGTGISDEVMARLFEPFFTTKSEETGTGLGLSICSGIVAEFGGAIQVDSNPGEGATFRVYLPSAAVKSAPITPVVQALPDIQSSTRTVLVAEDENAVRRMLASVLQQRGYTVMQAPNGQEALKIANQLRDGEIDLLLTDMIMPVMGGRALANEFKELHPSAKVLYTSGYTSDDIMLSDDLGADSAFMRKPFDLTTVSQQVHDLLKATPLRAA